MVDELPRYAAAPGAEAFAQRLRSLLVAGVPVRCPVYVGLGDPVEESARHARVTHTVAKYFAAGKSAALPLFNTNPPPVLRVLGAASLGRSDALGQDMDSFPADLASELWWQVERRTRVTEHLEPVDRRTAVDLLLRIGFPRRAATLLGLPDAGGSTEPFDPAFAMEQLAVWYRRGHDRDVLAGLALEGARDTRLPVATRLQLANFVVVHDGMKGVITPQAHEAAELARAALDHLPGSPFANALATQTYHRAFAYIPFLAGDVVAALRVLDLAEQAQLSAEPADELEELTWADHCFPLYETIARTRMAAGDPEGAVAATDRLVELSPGDQRTWLTRGRALLAAGRWEEAWDAYERMFALGGLPAATAAFYRGWTEERLGRRADAENSYRLSERIDPTATAVRERLAALAGAGTRG